MTISPLESEHLARQGNPKAIENLLNRYLQPTLSARVGLKSGCLQIMLESVDVPSQQDAVAKIQTIITKLKFSSAQTIKIYGREAGDEFPSWSEEFEYIPQPMPDVEELAQQGDLNAIGSLVSQWLAAPEIVVKASLKQNTLHLILEAIPIPCQQETVSRLTESLKALQIQECQSAKLYGRETGDEFPAWQVQINLERVELEQADDVPDLIAQLFESSSDPIENSPDLLTGFLEGFIPFDPFATPSQGQSPTSEQQATCLELAKQGDNEAIGKALNYILRSQGITAKTKFQNGYLQIVLQSDKSPDQAQCVSYVRRFVDQLQLTTLHRLQIAGWRKGATFQAWSQTIDLSKSQENTSLWGSLTKMVTDTGDAIGGAVSYAGQAVVGTTVSTVGGAAEAIGSMASTTGQTVAGVAIGAGEVAVNTAMQVPSGFGYVLEVINDSPQLQTLTKSLKMDWLVKIVNRVDVVTAEAHVQQLKRKHPKDKPSEIAHRIMTEKAIYIGGRGVASSLGIFVVDLETTTIIQAEMVYQIAAAYGLDLLHADRKGEVLAIFGLAMGGNLALKAGLGFLRNVPVAGAVIGASSNAVTLYALGYAARQFYEAKLNGLTSNEMVAASQQVIMDQILIHVILAGKPGKTWAEILPELSTLNLSPISLKVIEANIQSPPSLEALLKKINADFAVPLMAQCQKLAESDGIITSEEKLVLQTIKKTLNVNLSASHGNG